MHGYSTVKLGSAHEVVSALPPPGHGNSWDPRIDPKQCANWPETVKQKEIQGTIGTWEKLFWNYFYLSSLFSSHFSFPFSPIVVPIHLLSFPSLSSFSIFIFYFIAYSSSPYSSQFSIPIFCHIFRPYFPHQFCFPVSLPYFLPYFPSAFSSLFSFRIFFPIFLPHVLSGFPALVSSLLLLLFF